MEDSRGIHLGRIAGVDLVVDWSLLIIFALITFSLAAPLTPCKPYRDSAKIPDAALSLKPPLTL